MEVTEAKMVTKSTLVDLKFMNLIPGCVDG